MSNPELSSVPELPEQMLTSAKRERGREKSAPRTRGSTKLPTMAWTVVGMRNVRRMSIQDLVGSKTTTGIGRSVEMTPPTFGMKLRRKASSPKTSARSTCEARAC
eukprot:1820823-Rhodomonas_salina.1